MVDASVAGTVPSPHLPPCGSERAHNALRLAWRRSGLAPVTALAVISVLGCSRTPTGCDLCTTSAVVYGTVHDTAGSPQRQARVTLQSDSGSCAAPIAGRPRVLATATGLTDSTGQFRMVIASPPAPVAACIAVQAVVGADTGQATADSVWFTAGYPPGNARYSALADVVIQRNAGSQPLVYFTLVPYACSGYVPASFFIDSLQVGSDTFSVTGGVLRGHLTSHPITTSVGRHTLGAVTPWGFRWPDRAVSLNAREVFTVSAFFYCS